MAKASPTWLAKSTSPCIVAFPSTPSAPLRSLFNRAAIGLHDPRLAVLLDATHLAVARQIRSDRDLDRPVVGATVDYAQHRKTRGGGLNAVVALLIHAGDLHTPALRLPLDPGACGCGQALRRRLRDVRPLRSRDRALRLTQRHAPRQ